MREFLSDTDVSVTFRYGDINQPSIPDTGTVTYTLLDHMGLPVVGATAIPVTTGPSTFQSTVVIPAVYNAIDTLKQFERRTLIVNYESSGVASRLVIQYRLLPAVLYTTTPEAVRAFIGINPNELPDSDLDMYAAYLLTTADVDQLILDEALTSGTLNEMYANEAITMQAVLAIIPSLQARVAQSEKNGPMGFDRPKIVDFNALRDAAIGRYLVAIGLIIGDDGTTGTYTLIVTTQDADPVTG